VDIASAAGEVYQPYRSGIRARGLDLVMYAVLKPALDSVAKHAVRFALLKPLFWLSTEERVRRERRLRGREQWRKLAKADVVIVSYGKSGRTWLRVLMSRFYQRRHGLREHSLIGFDNFHLRDAAIPRVFFTHDNYTKDYTGNVDSKADYYEKKVVLLVRHPADVAVSQFHQWKFRMRPNKKTLNAYPDHAADMSVQDFMLGHEAGLQRAIDFLNQWGRELPRLRDLLIVRYEDMRADPTATLGRVLDFIGTPATSAELEDAVAYASFENMRQLEQRNRFWLAGGRMKARDPSNPESFKTRRGKVGGWRDYVDPALEAEVTRRIDASLLPLFGYTSGERTAPRVAEAAA
jgi:hypothetical protein